MSWDSPLLRRFVISVVTILLVWAALAIGQGRPGVALDVGSPSPVEFSASSTVTVVDEQATAVEKQAARDAVEPRFQIDNTKSAEAAEAIESVFMTVQDVALEDPPENPDYELPAEPEETTTTSSSIAEGEESEAPAEILSGRVTGQVFLDVDSDLVFSDNDIALPGVDVTVVGSDDYRVAAVTDGNGLWAADGVTIEGRVLVLANLEDANLPDSVRIASGNAFQEIEDPVDVTVAEAIAFAPTWAEREAAVDAMQSAYPLLAASTHGTLVDLAQSDVLREARGNAPEVFKVETEAIRDAKNRLDAGIREEELQPERIDARRIPPVVLIDGRRDDDAGAAAGDLVAENLRISEFEDAASTQFAQEQAAEAVDDVTVTFRAGDVIVAEGEELTQPAMDAIDQLNLNRPTSVGYGAILSLAIVLVALLFVYLARFRPGFWASDRRVTLLGAILVLSAVAVRATYALTGVAGDLSLVLGYVLPAAGIGFLVSILLDARMAVLASVALATMTGIVFVDAGFALYAAIATIAPVPLVSAISSGRDQRRAIFISGLAAAVIAFSVAWFFHMGLMPNGFAGVLQATAVAAVAGWVSSIVAIFLISAFESIFDITTNLRLLELVDRNHAALQLLQEKAWGSFNHSLMVGTLADRAARSIGANPLLARAAAYYHDIGKTEAPVYFIENQFGVPNPHDQMDPRESAKVIRGHVTDGLRIAKDYRVPSEVAEGIISHHGDGIMRYFYETAREQHGDDNVNVEEFRHVGHKPRSKEMAILMMADSLEGATRATFIEREPTPELIAEVVEKIVAEKVNDGQLSESPLTLDDLRRVKEAFVEALVGHYHQRIPYPNFPDEPDALGGSTSILGAKNLAPSVEAGAEATESREVDAEEMAAVPLDEPDPR